MITIDNYFHFFFFFPDIVIKFKPSDIKKGGGGGGSFSTKELLASNSSSQKAGLRSVRGKGVSSKKMSATAAVQLTRDTKSVDLESPESVIGMVPGNALR